MTFSFADDCSVPTEIKLESTPRLLFLSLTMGKSPPRTLTAWLKRGASTRRLATALSRWADTGELVDPGEAPATAPAGQAPEVLQRELLGKLNVALARLELRVGEGEDRVETMVNGLTAGLDLAVKRLDDQAAALGYGTRTAESVINRLAVLEGAVAALRAELAGKVSLDAADRLEARLTALERLPAPAPVGPAPDRMAALERLVGALERGIEEVRYGASDAEIAKAAREWAKAREEWDGDCITNPVQLKNRIQLLERGLLFACGEREPAP